MGVPISIRLEDDVREELEAQARACGIGLSTLLRDLAAAAARDARRARIRKESERVASYIAVSPDGRAVYEDWGAPTTDAG